MYDPPTAPFLPSGLVVYSGGQPDGVTNTQSKLHFSFLNCWFCSLRNPNGFALYPDITTVWFFLGGAGFGVLVAEQAPFLPHIDSYTWVQLQCILCFVVW